jgi:TPR repeat protein
VEKKGVERAPGPPRAKAPVVTPQDRENAEKLVARGERDLEQGNIALARQFFLRAAQAGLARGALLLAATYDPRELARMSAMGVQPNLAEARKWYERALELGASEASERLATLEQDRF